MPSAARSQLDTALAPIDSHGKNCCPHTVVGPGVQGSPDVMINGSPALRVGDIGVHAVCCGLNSWVVVTGSTTVTINDIAAARLGDITAHCGGPGTLITGSSNVNVGG